MQEPNDWVEIISIVAHDLKTPITAIKGFIELIKYSGPLNERQDYFGDRALSALRQMEHLVARLLELAWIDADRPLDPQPCDLCFLIDNTVTLLSDYAERRSVTLHLEIDPELGTVEADERRLEQVAMNLLSNAIKYNRRGGDVWIVVKGTEDNVEVSVHDTGFGISSEDLPNIFERFFRSQATHDEVIEGTGLGLSIVKSNVEKHGGHVWVDSVVDVGTTFGFSLPRVMRLNEGSAHPRESIGVPMDAPELPMSLHPDSGEQIDSVDDNLQEPPAGRNDDASASAGSWQ